MSSSSFDRLDDLLMRIRLAQQRPGWRGRLLAVSDSVTTLSTLRVLRAIERREQSGKTASVGDVAEYMAVEHSTASRAVSSTVSAGMVMKAYATDDGRRCTLELTGRGRAALAEITEQRRRMVAETVTGWADDDLDTLLNLLEQLAKSFDRQAPA
jgi:DNA-binding MarR family transcriptional regulator